MKMRRYTMNDNELPDPLCNLCDCIFSKEEGEACAQTDDFQKLSDNVQSEIRRRMDGGLILYGDKDRYRLLTGLGSDAIVIGNVNYCPVCGRKL